MKSPTHQFIEDAIAGGWEYRTIRPIRVEPTTNTAFKLIWRGDQFSKDGVEYSLVEPEAVVIDPLAWQAVGKTQGWPSDITAVEDRKRVVRMPQWQYNWHRLIDHLANGRTIGEALAAIQDGV